jgi:hypothetical protein
MEPLIWMLFTELLGRLVPLPPVFLTIASLVAILL